MAIRQNKQEIVSEFLELMYNDIKCKYSDDAGIKNVVLYLVEKGLIEPKRLRNYMIISDFNELLLVRMLCTRKVKKIKAKTIFYNYCKVFRIYTNK